MWGWAHLEVVCLVASAACMCMFEYLVLAQPPNAPVLTYLYVPASYALQLCPQLLRLARFLSRIWMVHLVTCLGILSTIWILKSPVLRWIHSQISGIRNPTVCRLKLYKFFERKPRIEYKSPENKFKEH